MIRKNWYKLSLAEQLGNIGSEITRAKHWEKLNDKVSCYKALERALELLNYTIADKRHRHRTKEILYLHEVIGDIMINTNFYDISLARLEKFCLNFGFKVRANSF